jgi:hypothetical protein
MASLGRFMGANRCTFGLSDSHPPHVPGGAKKRHFRWFTWPRGSLVSSRIDGPFLFFERFVDQIQLLRALTDSLLIFFLLRYVDGCHER